MSQVQTCPNCNGRKGRKRLPEERRIMRLRTGMPSDDTSTPYYYEELPEWMQCYLCEGVGLVNIIPWSEGN